MAGRGLFLARRVAFSSMMAIEALLSLRKEI